MIALDTNVLARYVLRDHPVLSPAALRLIEDNDCYVSRVVLLELYQVLESVYELPRQVILDILHTLKSLKQVALEDEANTRRAIEWHEAGMDFPDALVLSSAQQTLSVSTFDKAFAKTARKLKAQPEVIYRG